MNAAVYARARRDNTPARYALTLARWADKPQPFDWQPDRNGNLRAETVRDGFRIVARTEPDYAEPFDYTIRLLSHRYGERERVPAGAVPLSLREGPGYYLPEGNPIEDRIRYRHEHLGMSRAVAREDALAEVKREAESARDGQVVMLRVAAYRNGVELAADALGRIDLGDYDPIVPDADERYLSDAAEDMIGNVIDEARQTLAGLTAPEDDE